MSSYITSPVFNVRSFIAKSVKLFFGNIIVFGGLSLIPFVVVMVMAFLAAAGGIIDSEDPAQSVLGIVATAGLGVIVYIPMSVWANSIIVAATIQKMRTGSYAIGDCIGFAFQRLLWATIATILFALATTLGFMLLIVPGVIIWVMFYLFLPSCIVEDLGPVECLKRSMALTKGFRWELFGGVLLLLLIVFLASFLIAFASAIVSAMTGGVGVISLVSDLVSGVLSALSYVLFSVATAVAYHDLRVTHEGVDADRIAEAFE